MENILMNIKEDFINGIITFEQAKERIFNYAPHKDAINSNNNLLKLWTTLLTPNPKTK